MAAVKKGHNLDDIANHTIDAWGARTPRRTNHGVQKGLVCLFLARSPLCAHSLVPLVRAL